MKKVNSRFSWKGWLLCLVSYGCSQSKGLYMNNEQPSCSGNQTTNQEVGQGALPEVPSDEVKFVPVPADGPVAEQIRMVEARVAKDIPNAFVEEGNKKVVNVLAKNAQGETLLHFAIKLGDRKTDVIELGGRKTNNMNEDLCKWLVENGADKDAQDREGMTPLLLAIEHERYGRELAKWLIVKGANVNTKTLRSNVPLLSAARVSDTSVCELLIKHKAEVNVSSSSKKTPLHYVSSRGNVTVCKALLEVKDRVCADVDAQDGNDMTPLHLAVKFGYITACELLLKYNAKVDIKDKDGRTALDLAEHYKDIWEEDPKKCSKHKQILALLTEHNALVENRHPQSPSRVVQELSAFTSTEDIQCSLPPNMSPGLQTSPSAEDRQLSSPRRQMQGQELLGSTSTEDRQFPFPDSSTQGLELLASAAASAPQRQIKSEPVEQHEENQKEVWGKRPMEFWNREWEYNNMDINSRKRVIQRLKEASWDSLDKKSKDTLLQEQNMLIERLAKRHKLLKNMPWMAKELIDTTRADLFEAEEDLQSTIKQPLGHVGAMIVIEEDE